MSVIGIDTKIERAKHQIGELQVAIKTWGDAKPYEVIEYSEIDTKIRVWAIEVRHDVPPVFAGILGDVLNNLRTALDYIIWELAGGKGGSQLYFPISDTAKGFETKVHSMKNLVGDIVVKLLLTIQAYKGGSGHALWQLHELNRREKHRFLMPVGAAVRDITVDIAAQMKALGAISDLYPRSPTSLRSKPTFPLQDGAEVTESSLVRGRVGSGWIPNLRSM